MFGWGKKKDDNVVETSGYLGDLTDEQQTCLDGLK